MKTVQEITNQIFLGNSINVLRDFPSKSVDLVVTSPPYFNLRNYKHDDQIGNEKSVEYYIHNLRLVFQECKRILKDTGAIWVNIADKIDYDLAAVPEEFVLMMKKQLGLIRRRTIIWQKPSCMPQSDKSSFTVDFEYFYFFVKRHGYQFETQYEPMKTIYSEKDLDYRGQAIKDYENNGVQNPSDIKRRMLKKLKDQQIKFGGIKYGQNTTGEVTNNIYSGKPYVPNDNGERIKRCVWSINTANSKEAHYATYPEELIETPIKACTKEGDLILDPFIGSGTTAILAQKLNRNYVGIELNEDSYKITKRRLNNMISTWLRNYNG